MNVFTFIQIKQKKCVMSFTSRFYDSGTKKLLKFVISNVAVAMSCCSGVCCRSMVLRYYDGSFGSMVQGFSDLIEIF